MSLIDGIVKVARDATTRLESNRESNDLQNQLQYERNNLSDAQEEFRHQKDALELQKHILKDQLVEANKKILVLEKELHSVPETKADLSEVSLSTSDPGLTNDEITSLQNQLETLLPEYEGVSRRLEELSGAHSLLQQEQANTIQTLERSKEMNRELKDNIKLLKTSQDELRKQLADCEATCTNQSYLLAERDEQIKDNERAHRSSSRDLQIKITTLENENNVLQENVIKHQINLERAVTELAGLEGQYKKLAEEKKKNTKDSKSIRKVCAALQLRLKASEEKLKKTSLELEEERETSTNLGLRVCDLERKMRAHEMDTQQLRIDCQNWENLYQEAKASRDKMGAETVEKQKEQEEDLYSHLNRIVCLKDTLDNMKIEVVRHQTPGLKDLERLELCQRNIQLLVPEIRKEQHKGASDSSELFSEVAKVTSGLVMQLANHQQLINRFLARALGAKPVRRPLNQRQVQRSYSSPSRQAARSLPPQTRV